MKGFKQVSATCPTGTVTIVEGRALEVRNDQLGSYANHWSIHEKEHEQPGLLVAIFPKDWALVMVPNDVA